MPLISWQPSHKPWPPAISPEQSGRNRQGDRRLHEGISNRRIAADEHENILDHDHRSQLADYGTERLIRAINRDVEPGEVTASFFNRLSHAVDLIEQRSQQGRPLKIVKVRRGLDEDRKAARDRHYATHPEDRGANIVILEFYDDEEMAGEG